MVKKIKKTSLFNEVLIIQVLAKIMVITAITVKVCENIFRRDQCGISPINNYLNHFNN